MRRVKISTQRKLERIWFQSSWVTLKGSRVQWRSKCRCGGSNKRARVSSGAWRCDWLLPSHDETWMGEDVLPVDEWRKQFLERRNLFPVNMLWRLLKWHRIRSTELIKQRQGLRRLTPSLKEVPLWVKCYQTARREIIHETKSRLKPANFIVLFLRHCYSHSTLTLIDQQPSISKIIMTCWRLRWWLAFLAIRYF